MTHKKNLLFELGTEEIPARYIKGVLQALEERLRNELQSLQLSAGTITTLGTPRRLALIARDMPAAQPTRSEEVVGPPKAIAFDGDGNPTKAALGFATRLKVDVKDLTFKDTSKGERLAFTKTITGKPLESILKEILPRILGKLPFPKTMRWGLGETRFVRPVHWVVALVDGEVLPFTFAGISSGGQSYGHRYLAPDPIDIPSIDQYESLLLKAHVMVNPDQRRDSIQQQLSQLEQQTSGSVIPDDDLLEELAYLVEDPHCILGNFDSRYLSLPKEVLIAAMRGHQKYFSLADDQGAILPHFIVVAGTRVRDFALVRHGNERVLTARLEDARFFYNEDLKLPLDSMAQGLKERVFLQDLGSTFDKMQRIKTLGQKIGTTVGHADVAKIGRAAELCKADLMSFMVGEFPEIQGVMGRIYAQAAGADSEVAQSIEDHYRPRFAGDELPATAVGAIISLADKIDSIVGSFTIGLVPTGTQDPFALRRQTIGIIRTLLDREWNLTLSDLISWSIEIFTSEFPEACKRSKPAEELHADVRAFLKGRFKHYFGDKYATDSIDAAIEANFDNVCDAQARLQAISHSRNSEVFDAIAVGFKRAQNIIKKAQEIKAVDPSLFAHDVERELFEAFSSKGESIASAAQQHNYTEALDLLCSLKDPIDNFFENVMVMDKNLEIQHNRLGLLQAIVNLFTNIADFSKIQTRGELK